MVQKQSMLLMRPWRHCLTPNVHAFIGDCWLQAYMAAAAAEAAGLEEIDLDQNLLELGLDSLRAAEFASQACTRSLVDLPTASGAFHSVCFAGIAVSLSRLASS